MHYSSLRIIGVKEQFLGYIGAIGFDWLLEHAPCEVPVNLAKEFFTSFHFDYTSNLDNESVYFGVFNQEMVMTLREWSLRLGLLSSEEEKRGEWSLWEIGQPKYTEEFNAEEAWNLIGAEGEGPFKTSVSTGEEIVDPVLRMSHVFLAHNLLGQSNTTITTIEVYFTWCMLKEVKVHLGYCLAHARHPVLHLYACHLLRAYLIRNIMPKLTIPKSSIAMCKDPEWFDTTYLISIGIIKRKQAAKVFCEAGQSEEENEEGESEEDEELMGLRKGRLPLRRNRTQPRRGQKPIRRSGKGS